MGREEVGGEVIMGERALGILFNLHARLRERKDRNKKRKKSSRGFIIVSFGWLAALGEKTGDRERAVEWSTARSSISICLLLDDNDYGCLRSLPSMLSATTSELPRAKPGLAYNSHTA